MPLKYIKVRARSAKEGSAAVGWSLALLGPACFAVDKEAIAMFLKSVINCPGLLRGTTFLNTLTRRGISCLIYRREWRLEGAHMTDCLGAPDSALFVIFR